MSHFDYVALVPVENNLKSRTRGLLLSLLLLKGLQRTEAGNEFCFFLLKMQFFFEFSLPSVFGNCSLSASYIAYNFVITQILYQSAVKLRLCFVCFLQLCIGGLCFLQANICR